MDDKMSKDRSLIPLERIERCILLIRGQKLMLDRDLAQLYGVETRVLLPPDIANDRVVPIILRI